MGEFPSLEEYFLARLLARMKKRKKSYTIDMVEFDLVMQTTKSGTHDSESCLVERTCLPLGGYRLVVEGIKGVISCIGGD
ncbi:hypothetical protein Sjap_014771 [Stephania japonica]|uniref:Uncharacterized protein n=1 Tax=Stephania japonica TaxID=461633 RepID=A0AAP0NRT2_9MAGN